MEVSRLGGLILTFIVFIDSWRGQGHIFELKTIATDGRTLLGPTPLFQIEDGFGRTLRALMGSDALPLKSEREACSVPSGVGELIVFTIKAARCAPVIAAGLC